MAYLVDVSEILVSPKDKWINTNLLRFKINQNNNIVASQNAFKCVSEGRSDH